jgi:hypothetical protein
VGGMGKLAEKSLILIIDMFYIDMKKVKSLLSIPILIILCGNFISCINGPSNPGNENLKNIKLVEIGMDTSQVITIMGEPIQKRLFKENLFFDYDLPKGSSGQLTITFDTIGQVIDKGNIP